MKEKLARVAVIVGPTGVGKTAISLRLAERFNAEIVSADSMQIYRGMNIGTAKASAAERARIPHHCIDFLPITERYSVAQYQKDARAAITQIQQRGKLPILVGGSGLYVRAALEPYDFSQAKLDLSLRSALQRRAAQEGNLSLLNELAQIDSQTAAKLHVNDTKRIIRALEVYYSSGQPISLAEQETKDAAPLYQVLYLGLTRPREELYARIEQRIDAMFEQGLPEEVRQLIGQGLTESLPAGQALGYKEFFPYFRAEISLAEVAALLKQNTRRYAKRQLTWFRANPEIHWFDLSAYATEEILLAELQMLVQQTLFVLNC
ncbi:MAG: tRNA (adenosine(37)-N6)-dimethylallyltransferase MiaA [Negativicutes bacterium]|nr:tRNA (adenosine(37)-N6)-dimethylallyltransferase MiaA [Negativicutes bacterium]